MDFNTDFDKRFNQTRRGFTLIGGVVFTMIVLFIIVAATFVGKTKGSGKTIYTITTHNFNSEESYMSDSIVSQDANKIVFFDMFGLKRTVSSPGISVTQFGN